MQEVADSCSSGVAVRLVPVPNPIVGDEVGWVQVLPQLPGPLFFASLTLTWYDVACMWAHVHTLNTGGVGVPKTGGHNAT